MYQHTLDVKAEQPPYFRTDQFSKLTSDTDKLFKELIGTDCSSFVMYLASSGTAAMEAAICNLFSKKEKLLIVNGGTFGQRFVEICKRKSIPFDEIQVNFGEDLVADHFSNVDGHSYSGLCVNLHETSIGKLYNIELISNFCKNNNILLVADAMTTFMCDDFRMDDFGVDVSIVSSHKGLCLSPGLSMLVLNQKALAKSEAIVHDSLYFSLKDYRESFQRCQIPYTPAIGILLELNDMLKRIDSFGLVNRLSEIESRARYFRDGLKDLDLTLPPYKMSFALTPVNLNNDLAIDLFDYLRNNCELMVNPSGYPHSKKMIRISHIGDLRFEDYDYLLSCLEDFLYR